MALFDNESAGRMMVIAVGETLRENIDTRLYYAPTDRGYRAHRYLALYSGKSIRAIGELENIVSADLVRGKLSIQQSALPITADQADRIVEAIRLAPGHDYDIRSGHRFFLVDDFAMTDFRKTSFGGLRAKRYFDVRAELGLPNGAVLPSVSTIAAALTKHTWH